MITNSDKRDLPNLGCKLGIAYQTQLSGLEESLKKYMTGITSSEYLVLRVLYANNKLQPCEIASILRKDKAAICRTLKALERKELIYTESVSRKCVKVNISEKGLDIKNEIMKVAQERQKALESVISENEINLLTEILDKIIIENKI